MHSVLAYFAFLFALFGTALTTDYCDPSLCPNKTNIACNNDGQFASTCVEPQEVVFTQQQKDAITNLHNEKRNKVAGGKSFLNAACRMATIQWDDELAYMATLNVKQCEIQDDECRNTDAFKHSGQNIGWMNYYSNPNITNMAERAIDLWFNEIMDTDQTYIDKYPRNLQGPVIGHFTVMVVDRNIRLGCAAATYLPTGENYYGFLFTCNYATTNVVNYPVYKSCTKGGAECKTGRNPDYPYLCSTSEEYNVNKFH
ncbi:venom allergen 3 [Ceratitis capitata]|nr:venom allergen 3 [Ceratitis capitata]